MKMTSRMAPRPTIMRGKLDTTLEMVSSFCTLAADASSITTLYPRKTEKLITLKNKRITRHWCFAVLSAFPGFWPHWGTWQGTPSRSGFEYSCFNRRSGYIITHTARQARKFAESKKEVLFVFGCRNLRESQDPADQDVNLSSLVSTHNHSSSLPTQIKKHVKWVK